MTLKVGDRCFHTIFGWGEGKVIKIDSSHPFGKYCVRFKNYPPHAGPIWVCGELLSTRAGVVGADPFEKGQRVYHPGKPKWGRGVVVKARSKWAAVRFGNPGEVVRLPNEELRVWRKTK